jgi:hypothetical protein
MDTAPLTKPGRIGDDSAAAPDSWFTVPKHGSSSFRSTCPPAVQEVLGLCSCVLPDEVWRFARPSPGHPYGSSAVHRVLDELHGHSLVRCLLVTAKLGPSERVCKTISRQPPQFVASVGERPMRREPQHLLSHRLAQAALLEGAQVQALHSRSPLGMASVSKDCPWRAMAQMSDEREETGGLKSFQPGISQTASSALCSEGASVAK